jgi:CubicO group peptidase (beta-lactamase class C family)
MRKPLSNGLLVSALSLVLLLPSWGQGAPSVTAEISQQIDAVFAPWKNPQSPGCVLGISRNGLPIYLHGYGMSNLEYDIPITPESIFQAGSIAKQFTAFAIALLASDGKLSLDDDVHRYLPELPDYGGPVTLRQLLAHTAGFPDYGFLLRRAGWRFEDVVTESDVLRISRTTGI